MIPWPRFDEGRTSLVDLRCFPSQLSFWRDAVKERMELVVFRTKQGPPRCMSLLH
jgi:hypothetical protein